MKPAKNRLAFDSTALIPHASTMVKELLDRTMNDDPIERPTAEEVHIFFYIFTAEISSSTFF